MSSRTSVLIAALALCPLLASGPRAAQSPVDAPAQAAPLPPILKSLRLERPRLHVREAELEAIRARLVADLRVRAWRDRLRADADRMLGEPPAERVLVGPRLLAQSRAVLRRVTTLAGLYLLDGNPRYLARARDEMLAAARFEDWNPSHFLDVAEMTNALGIGYDWLHPYLSADERQVIRDAIIRKGLEPGLEAIAAGAWWATQGRNNWTQVCIGGLVTGALAVADEAPDVAARVIEAARGEGLARRMRLYAPDGGDEEGPAYWSYATSYTVFLLSALETALGDDFGIAGAEGFDRTGDFRLHVIGPSGRVFNYGDGTEATRPAPQMFWLAGRFDRPDYAAHERERLIRGLDTPRIFHLLWIARLPDGDASVPPRARLFDGVDVAFLRGDWRDPNASWVGFKGGRNGASHAHLDLGTFVFDARGERWAIDLGSDDYDLPGYFGRQRWTYYRLRTESHNTLLVNGTNQATDASAPIVAFSDDFWRAFAVADLTAAYAPALSSARRGVMLIDGRDLLVQDEVESADGADVIWQMLTRARVTQQGLHALLEQGGQQLSFRVLEPQGAVLHVGPASAPPPQTQQPEVSVLRVFLPQRTESARFVIWMSPGDRPAPEIVPLSEWKSDAP
ncbi:MAG TPA: heparinase II/III family protein [Vicinamibacterales bacterium]